MWFEMNSYHMFIIIFNRAKVQHFFGICNSQLRNRDDFKRKVIVMSIGFLSFGDANRIFVGPTMWD